MKNIKKILLFDELSDVLNSNSEYEKALKLVSYLFKERVDKGGEPYLGHLLRVSNSLSNETTRIAGLLHDTVEDIPNFSFSDLRELGFSSEVIHLVRMVTKDSDSNYLKYHDKISQILESKDLEAIKLKYADMSDNFDKERMNLLDVETRERLTCKYEKEIVRLRNYLEMEGCL